MNVENILRVADAIEQHSIPDFGFLMSDWMDNNVTDYKGDKCGTVACVAGHAYAVATGNLVPSEDLRTTAQAFLGLDSITSDDLFCPYTIDIQDWEHITPDQAVRTLRHLAATGEVRWNLSAD